MPTTLLASNAPDREALDAIERQHAQLVGGLSARTASLLTAVRRDEGWEGARDALVEWCRAELIPHAEVEEVVLYPAARASPALEPLVRAMSHEHALLDHLVTRVASAVDASVALVHAGAVQTLFETHVAKENDLLLPAMVVVPELDTLTSPQAPRHATNFGALESPTEPNDVDPAEQRSQTVNTEVHAPRREPTEAEGPLDLHAVADELLAEAGQLRSGRSARTLTPGPGAPLKQTILALTAGQELQEHVAPGPTTLLGIRGTSTLTDEHGAVTLTGGLWAACPTGPHTVEAISDAVLLITVTPTGGEQLAT